ncbi:expressed unknown protein [Seminavis robusta]|uniref:Uncharacterized protein n=1 Tax=Seminavis robusta TaxID=568900 RepID=A0A9N8DU35_9STRA|nr:expressed unknown protein [Seminavis robusta]|eukprot:Sro292_g109540.1 n/a (172) ;mRNA; f:3580-4095
MIANIATTGRKLFFPNSHLWLRARKELLQAARLSWLVDVGLTQRKLDDIGDVSSVNTLVPQERVNRDCFVQAGQNIMEIQWDGLTISGADELYHTVYETYEESTLIQSPLSGMVLKVNTLDPDREELDEDTILLQMRVDTDSLNLATKNLVQEGEYNDFVRTLPRGRFQDS